MRARAYHLTREQAIVGAISERDTDTKTDSLSLSLQSDEN